MDPQSIPTVGMAELIDRHEVLLLDAYGVLLHHGGPLPGAVALIEQLGRLDKPYLIITNDASRLPATTARQMAAMGLPVPEERILSTGTLLAPHFAAHGLQGRRCLVLGPDDSRQLVRQAGGELVGPGDPLEVLVICDEAGFDFVPAVDAALTAVIAALDAGRTPRLLLPNPDLIYPRSETAFGFTAGSIAAMFEAALAQRYPGRDELTFERLGKPETPIFTRAVQRAGTDSAVMVGDQLRTDILGANRAGIPSALVCTGLASLDPAELARIPPRYLLRSIAP